MLDSHCHLADEAFRPDFAETIARAHAAGVQDLLCIISADEPAEVQRAADVRAAWPGVRFAAGIHPHRAAPYAGRVHEAADITREVVRSLGASAVGEMGLDYHYDLAPREVQRDLFAAQLALAVRLDLPVIIHTREASDDTFDAIRAAGPALRGVLHCFSGTSDEARTALDLGLSLSFSGIVTFPKAQALRDVAASVPDDRLLIETDAPFLAPVPHRGKRNEPGWVLETLRTLARVRGTTEEALGATLARNFEQFVRPPARPSVGVR